MIRITNEIIDSRLAGRNVNRVSDYINAKTRCLFRCSEGHEWFANVSAVTLYGRGCKRCSDNKLKRPLDELELICASKNIRLLNAASIINMNSKASLECAVPTCGHRWSCAINSIAGRRNSGCPKCANRLKITNEVLDSRLPKAISRVSEVKGNNKSRVIFRCMICSNEWTTKISGVINNGTGCPKCAKGAFNPDKASVIYVMTINDEYVGYGISNKFKTRYSNHKLELAKHNVTHELITTFECSGKDARRIERIIKNAFPPVGCVIDGFKTESTHIHNLPKVLDLIRNNLP